MPIRSFGQVTDRIMEVYKSASNGDIFYGIPFFDRFASLLFMETFNYPAVRWSPYLALLSPLSLSFLLPWGFLEKAVSYIF